jgi:hypothetical protein
MSNNEYLELWKPIVGFEDRYEVSNLGRLRSVPRKWHTERGTLEGRLLKTSLDKAGYEQIKLRGSTGNEKSAKVHILVAAAFIGPRPEGHRIDHLDADRSNNKLTNLEYVTVSEDIRRMDLRHGGRPWLKGAGNPKAKLTDQKVRQIRRLATEGLTYRQLAEKYNITPKHAYKIVRLEEWQWVK